MNRKKIRTKIDIQFRIALHGAMAIGSGFPRGQVDRTVVQNFNGLPYIPASVLKGRVRDIAERLAKTLGYETCVGPNPDFMCPAQNKSNRLCVICRTFGTAGLSSRSGLTAPVWRDAKIYDEQIEDKIDEPPHFANDFFYARTQVQLSRPRGVALAKHLFTAENTIENLQFNGRIRGWMPCATPTAGKYPEEIILLCAALRLLNFVGGGKSRGLGHCNVHLAKNILVNDENVAAKEILQQIVHLDQRQS